MWNRLSGKSSGAIDDKPSRRNDSEEQSKQSRSGSVISSNSYRKSALKRDDQLPKASTKSSSRGDDRDRGFNPSSSSYSSTTQNAYPGTASASVATASRNHNDEPYYPADLVRNASLGDHMPKSKSSRNERQDDRDPDLRSERRRTRNSDEKGRVPDDERREKRDKRDKGDRERNTGLSRSSKRANGYREDGEAGTSRGPTEFPNQVGAAGFSQFPGQYHGAIPHANGSPADHPISSHVQDQFPGQFPVQSATPYRPPIAISEGGPGLAAEYYGDAGESVAEQPGNRTNTPSLIIGAEPHLQPALAVAAPPPEPSASGGVGAAASFFSGEFHDEELATSHGQQSSSTYTTAPTRPSGSHHSSSAPVIPTLGGAALGTAMGYVANSQDSSHAQHPNQLSSTGVTQGDYIPSTYQRPPSPTVESYYSHNSQPSRPGKQSSHSSHIPMHAAGAAGLAATAYHQSHHSPSPHDSIKPQHPNFSMAQRHRHRGPLGAVVDFFKDPDGVAQFEEYSEIIGVCRYCFAPGSTPRDAPRKHHYRKRRSNEGFGRIEKENRYHSSESETRRKKDNSWLANGLAGYGLAKVGESLFKQKNDFDDTYSIRTGRHSPGRRSQKSRPRSRSNDRVETGTTSDGRIHRKDPHGNLPGGSETTIYSIQYHSRSNSPSRHRKSSLADEASGATLSKSRRRRSPSPRDPFVRTKHSKGERSPERRPKLQKKKKKARGFFSLGSASSSSSNVDLAQESNRNRSSKRSSTKSKDDKKAEAALMGLGAAAAALALNDGRTGSKKKGVQQLVGVKETRDKHDQSSRHDERSEEEMWESAPENDYESADSGLAYGVPRRRGSRDSLSSQSSGTDKWDWRWGSKKRRESSMRRKYSDHSSLPVATGAGGVDPTNGVIMPPNQQQIASIDSTSSLPLQQVFPVPTADPNRFDVGRDGSITSSGRPAVIPIQHPQPITPVSTALYSSQAPYEHSYSAPVGLPTLPRPEYPPQSTAASARFNRPDFDNHSGFAQDIPQAKDVSSDLKMRRRDSSPAKFGAEAVLNSTIPRRRSSAKDHTSAVRFDRTEEEEENDRRERRRKRREDRERRKAEEREGSEKEHRSSRDKPSQRSDIKTAEKASLEESSVTPWAAPAAAGMVGAAIGTAAIMEQSKSEESREERRERRRREREREKLEDEEAARRREKRRREKKSEREHADGKVIESESQILPNEIPEVRDDPEIQAQIMERKEKSVWQEAATPKKSGSHENYRDFFRPLDLSDDQAKITSTNADADIDFDQAPAIVTVEPKGFRDIDAQPVFSAADTDEKIDISGLSFPVPKLRLVEPTPPSSRGSTPTIYPRDIVDEVIEEGPRDPSPPKVTWGDGQTHEYTVITPGKEQQELDESAPDEIGDRNLADAHKPPDERASAVAPAREFEDSEVIKSDSKPPSYGDDVGFAATLAASAEAAGFDPSIVINDPKYRRRESPPNSQNRTMPGGFDDKDDSTLSKRERKKKDRVAKRRDQEAALNTRDDNAVVQDIISQVENPESQTNTDLKDDLDDDWESSKKSKSKKSKKGRKGTDNKDEFFETSESITHDQKPERRDGLESPSEPIPHLVSEAPPSNNGEHLVDAHKNANHDRAGADDTVSSVSSPSTVSRSHESATGLKDIPKGSMWDRVLGRSRDKVPKENDIIKEDAGNLGGPKKKGKKSRERRSARDGLEVGSDFTESDKTREILDQERSNAEDTAPGQDRVSQDLAAEDQAPSPRQAAEAESVPIDSRHPNGIEHNNAGQSESFLDRRPEPPPPPDISAPEKGPPTPSKASSPPNPPHSPSEDRTQQSVEAPTPGSMSSPTAVPFDFRFSRPRPSIGSARSMSQTPLPSYASTNQTPRPKPRPRSTEFPSSKEFRPLTLVERHKSYQDSTPQGTYPSLLYNRTTSQSSSIHNPEDGETGHNEMTELSQAPSVAGHEVSFNSAERAPQPDLLGSQKATPTASSFQISNIDQISTLPPGSKHSSPSHSNDLEDPLSLYEGTASNTMIAELAASALQNPTQERDLTLPSLPREELDQYLQSLDEIAPSRSIRRTGEYEPIAEGNLTVGGDEVLPQKEVSEQRLELEQKSKGLVPDTDDKDINNPNEDDDYKSQEQSDFSTKNSEDEVKEQDVAKTTADQETVRAIKEDPVLETELDPEEQFAPQKAKKSKKSKHKASKSEASQEQVALPVEDAAINSEDKAPFTLNPEETRQIQEQDAQDAVDSWFSPAASLKRNKKQKKKGIIEQLPEQAEPSSELNSALEKDGGITNLTALQETGRATKDKSFDQASNSTNPAAQDLDKTDEDVLRFGGSPDGDLVKGQLERRQSKSKGKKGKRGRKSTLQDINDQPTFQVPDTSSSEPFSEQVTESGGDTSEAAAAASSNKADEILEQKGTEAAPEIQLSPSNIPLPIDDDVDLQAEHLLDMEMSSNAGLENSEARPLPTKSSYPSQTAKENQMPEWPSEQSPEVEGEKDEAVAPIADPLAKGSAQDASAIADLEVKEPLLEDEAATMHERAQLPAAGPVEVSQEDVKLAEINMVGLSGKKKGKKAKQSSGIDLKHDERIGIELPQHIAASEAAEDKQRDDPAELSTISTSQEGPGAIGEEWAGFSSKKNGRKAKKSSKKSALESSAGVNEEGSTQPIATPEVFGTQDVNDYAQPDSVDTFQEKRGSLVDEPTGSSSEKNIEAATATTLDTIHVAGEGAKSATETALLATDELLEGEALSVPANAVGLEQQPEEPKAAEDEWAGFSTKKKGKKQKKEKKEKSKMMHLVSDVLKQEAPLTEAVKPDSIETEPVEPRTMLNESQPNYQSESAAKATIHATTSTSQELSMILEYQSAQPSFDEMPKETSSSIPSTNLRSQELDTSAYVGGDETYPAEEKALNQPVEDPEVQEIELIDQYRDSLGEKASLTEKAADSPTRGMEAQELEIVEQYGNEEPAPESFTATTDTARDVQYLLTEENAPGSPSHADSATNLSVVEAPSTVEPLEESTSKGYFVEETEGGEAKQNEDILPAGLESAERWSSERNSDDADRNQDLLADQTAGGDSKNGETLLDDYEAKHPVHAPDPLEHEVLLDRGPIAEVIDDSFAQKVKKSKRNKRGGERAVSDHQVGNESDLIPLEVRPSDELEPKDFGYEKSPLAVENTDAPRLQETQHLEPSVSPEPAQILEVAEQAHESEPATFQESRPSENRKDRKSKKKAKKAKALSWVGGEEDALVGDEKPLPETSIQEDRGPDKSVLLNSKVIDEPADTLESRPKSKKDRKKASKAQSSSWEREDVHVETEQDLPGQRNVKVEASQPEAKKARQPLPRDLVTADDDDAEPPINKAHDQHAEDQLSGTLEGSAYVAPLPAETAPKPSTDESQAQAEIYGDYPNRPIGAVEDPKYTLKRSKKDKKKGKKTDTLTVDDQHVQHEPEEATHDRRVSEVPSGPSIVPILEGSQDRLRPERSIEEIKPAEISEPSNNLTVSQDDEQSPKRETSSEDADPLVKDGQEDFVVRKTSKKGKKSKKGKLSTLEAQTDPSITASVSSTSGTESSRDHVQALGEQSQDVPYAVEEPSDTLKAGGPSATAEFESTDTSQPPSVQEISNMKPEDEAWDMPTKKGKQQRKEQPKPPKSPEVPEPSSEPLESAQDPAETIPGVQYFIDEATRYLSTDLRTQTPKSELLDPLEQRNYDLQYTQELRKQGVETPRSSRAKLAISAAKAEVGESQGPWSPNNENTHQQQDPEALESLTKDLDMQASQGDMENPHIYGEHEQEYLKIPGRQDIGVTQCSDASSLAPRAEDQLPKPQEQYCDSQESTDKYGQDEGEASQIPSQDLPTPLAEIEMLDAQEQQEYDNAYAKELERQLSPLQGAGHSDAQIDEAHLPSNSLPSMDSLVSLPYEQRAPVARPPPLEDIIEESNSRAGSAQENPQDRNDGSPPFKAPKKSKKGKKCKKQQQAVIWEDDTATPPFDNAIDQIQDAPTRLLDVLGPGDTGDPSLPPNLEEPSEPRQVEERSSTPSTYDGKAIHQTEADDYFTIQPDKSAEEDVGRNPEHSQFGHSLSTALTSPTQEVLPKLKGETSAETSGHSIRRSIDGDARDAESIEYTTLPKTASTPASKDVDDSFNYASTKRSKSSKKTKRRELERLPSPTTPKFEDPIEPSQQSGRSTMERSMSHKGSLKGDQYVDNQLSSREEQSTASDIKPVGTEGVVAATGLGAASSTIEGLSKRDSKKEGRKSKKGKKTKWTDIDEETPRSGSAVVEDQAVVRGAEEQTLEQESTVTEPNHKASVPEALPHSLTDKTYPLESGIRHDPLQLQSQNYRDSAINVFDSPIISEEAPLHHPVRDSGYPETESSPTVEMEQAYQKEHVERDDSRARGRKIEQGTQEVDPGHQVPERERSITEDQPRTSMGVDPNHGNHIEKLSEKSRRSKSYDSNDSADSGFDIQRRRRQQAKSKDIRDPSPVSSTTKDRSSALFNSSPSARGQLEDQSHQQNASTGNASIQQEPTWSFSRGDSPQPSSGHASRPPFDPFTYDKLTGHREEPQESLFGGPVRHDEDITLDSRSPPSKETQDRYRQLNAISEDTGEHPSLTKNDKCAASDVTSSEGAKERRVRSPSATAGAESHLSTEYPLSYEAGGPTEYGKGSTDFEESQSHDAGQVSSKRRRDLSNLPIVPPMPPKQWDGEHRAASAASMRSDNSIHALIRTPDQVRSASGQSYRSSGTPPLRHVDLSASGDLRGASKLGEAKFRTKTSEAEPDLGITIPSSSTYDPVTDKGKNRADMADVYEGWGDVRGQSPMSPTRPPSMRKRQSMQLLDLETRLDQLISENRLLQSQKSTAERNLQDQTRDHSQQRHAYEEALQEHKIYLAQKDSELNELRERVDDWQSKVDQLTEANEALTLSRALNDKHEQRYRELEDEHSHLKERHTDLTTGMEALVQREVATHLDAKNAELQQLRVELESAKQQVRTLQQQLLASKESEDFVERDEDYFDTQCQSLCQHVQQWVLRFSKFSDMKACYRASEIRDETKVDRMENAILDGTDVDIYLQDRVKRRDVFMAVVMTMIFDYIFTRYLFGMDREQRQKLKNLEKTLQDIGPMSAVCKWRATTLTLLMKRDDFARQRATDTEAIVHEIYDTLATFLPPPAHLITQIQDSLRKVINAAADLSIEMRTQRADYQMLPPLQPDYDTNGDLAQKVYFNALTMNERSGATTSNQVLQEQGAVVRMVLFPLVVKNEEDDEQIIVCPAQVLTASSKGKKSVRVMSVQGSTQGGRSEASFADMDMEGGMI